MVLATRMNGVPETRSIDFPAQIDQAFDRLFNGARAGLYPVDVREDENQLYIEAELPGFKKEELDITLEDQVLTISAERKSENQQEAKGEVLLRERRNERFTRSFRLPPTIDANTVNAKLQDGVLFITLNKREETKARKISVA